MKELTMNTSVATFRARFEAGRSFDLDDDLEFCPELLTDEEVECPISTVIRRARLGGFADTSQI